MPWRTTFKLAIDLLMTGLGLFAMAYRITGERRHEWIGIAASALFVLHAVLNRRWYFSLFKGRYSFRRILNTVVNLLLVAVTSTLAASGILISRVLFPFEEIGDGMFIRQAHAFAAYWFLILIAVHIGMHWEMIAGMVRKATGSLGKSRRGNILLRVLTVPIILYGIWASFDREMGSKLFLGYAFDFWDPDRPVVFFFTGNLAIMSVYICATHYALRLTQYIHTRKGS